ncbi:BrnT family toxin [Candidatus Thiosymbion oneisti]|uniref:BrnT family toxin n=1 Tax=Candidatus Thiosymbion oneisti TaxID=589554 RepID=UPI000A429E9B|nr:BrnT family toxin [Candidatus Thiosymbion oneisti]
MKFEWDVKKEKTNIQKHGVRFEQAAYVFADPFALNKYDAEHSHAEDRWIILGKSLNEVILVVVHMLRDDEGTELVRIISARKATKCEQLVYQKRRPQ